MKLALERGISHSELLATTSAPEVQEYRALNSIDPLFAVDRIDMAASAIAAVIFNMWKRDETPSVDVGAWPDHAAWLRPPVEPSSTDVPDQLDRFFESNGL